MSRMISNKERNEIKLSIKNSINKNEINEDNLKQFIEEKVEIELRNRLNVKIFELIKKNEELLLQEEIFNKKIQVLNEYINSYYQSE